MIKHIECGRFVELYFDYAPEENMKETLKACDWWFDGKKRCWRNYNNAENRQFAALLSSNEDDEPMWYEDLDRYYFESDNQIIVRTNSFYCNSHHTLEDVAGEISVIDRQGNIHWYIVPMAFCETCCLYYILKETYLELKKFGIIRCQIMTFQQYAQDGFYDGNFENWREKGPLKLWGYSIDSKTDLSEHQRRAILEDIVDCKAMTKDAVLSYLDFFIKLADAKHATYSRKWKDDRNYLAQYKLGSAKRVIFHEGA